MERGPFWLYMTGWLLAVASGDWIVITLLPFLAQSSVLNSKFRGIILLIPYRLKLRLFLW